MWAVAADLLYVSIQHACRVLFIAEPGIYGQAELTRLNFISNPTLSSYALLNFGDISYYKHNTGKTMVTPTTMSGTKMFDLVVVCVKSVQCLHP